MTKLITLDRAKTIIPNLDSESDDTINTLIEAASAYVEKETHRTFSSTSYDELYDGRHDGIVLNHHPVTAVSRISIDRETILEVRQSDDTTNQRATVEVTSSGLTLTRIASGSSSSSSVTFADNTTVQALATSIDDLGNGWEATANAPYTLWKSSDVHAQGPYDALNVYAEIDAFVEDLDLWEIDSDEGIIYARFPRGLKNVRIQYTAGYSSVPDDIQQLVAELCRSFLDDTERSAGLQSERLGDYQYTRSQMEGALSSLSPFSRRTLWLYKDYSRMLPQRA